MKIGVETDRTPEVSREKKKFPSFDNMDIVESGPWPGWCYKDQRSSAQTRRQALSRASEQLGRAGFDPQPSPPEPRPCLYYSHSQSNCAQCQQLTHWTHRGQFAQPAGYALRRPVDLAAPAGRQIHTFTLSPTNTTSLSLLKHCSGSSLLEKCNTNKNTHVLLVRSTTTRIFVRLCKHTQGTYVHTDKCNCYTNIVLVN